MKRVIKYLADKAWLRLVTVVLLLLGFGPAEQSFGASGSETNSEIIFKELTTFDPHFDTNLSKLASSADAVAKREKKESKAAKKLTADTENLKDLPTAALQKMFTDDALKYEGRAFSAIGKLATDALRAENPGTRAERVTDILEIQAALRNEGEPLVPAKLGVFTTWIFFFKNLSGSIGHGRTVASNLAGGAKTDNGGKLDPLPSTFWTRPASIAQENLYAGFGRDQLPQLDICDYSAPKISTGTHAGFDVECNGQRFKIKFGDISSEPLTARIFFALG